MFPPGWTSYVSQYGMDDRFEGWTSASLAEARLIKAVVHPLALRLRASFGPSSRTPLVGGRGVATINKANNSGRMGPPWIKRKLDQCVVKLSFLVLSICFF